MRDIEFRGLYKGVFVYGNLIIGYGETVEKFAQIENTDIDNYYLWEVDISSIGQYTGLKDKNGVKIFEGDIKEWVFNNLIYKSECYWSDIDNGFRWKLIDHNCKLKDHDGDIFFSTEEEYYDYVIKSNQRQNGFDRWSTIIGNIHEVTK